jgi:hypothetical protein
VGHQKLLRKSSGRNNKKPQITATKGDKHVTRTL